MLRRVFITLVLISASLPFSAQRVSATTVTVAAAGDIARNSLAEPQQQTADLITAFQPTGAFALGDDQYPYGSFSDFESYYDQSWGAFKSITYPVPGNHEYDTSGAAGYYEYFGAAAGDPTKGYYAFDLGSWRIYALNSECKHIDCNAEKSWLKADLASDQSGCELAFYHRTGLKWPRALLEADHGELVLAGHKHIYERYFPENGLLHFTVGTGGDSLGKPTTSGVAASFAAYGVLELTLNDGGYGWQFVDVDGTVRDSGSASCV